MLRIYRDTENIQGDARSPLFTLIKEMDSIVDSYSLKAYDLSFLNTGRPRQHLWLNMIKNEDFIEQRLVYARFGYAVEEIVSDAIEAKYQGRANGYRIRMQFTHGNTRPDIVIVDGNDEEVAWLDITSERSEGHIYEKDGSQWYTRPFVAELLYKSFDMTNIRRSSDPGLGAQAKMFEASRKIENRNRKRQEFMIDKLMQIFRLYSSELPRTQKEVADKVEEYFGLPLPSQGKHPIIKSMLLICCNNSNIFCSGMAIEILNKLYKDSKRDLSAAMYYVADAYELEAAEQELNSIYERY